MRATMTAAAMATIATVETARSIVPLSSRRLYVLMPGAERVTVLAGVASPTVDLTKRSRPRVDPPAASEGCALCPKP